MNLENLITSKFDLARSKKWDQVIIAVDLHDTVMKSDKYNQLIKLNRTEAGAAKVALFQEAILPLKHMTARKDICLVWYTGTNQDTLGKISLMLKEEYGIVFDNRAENLNFSSVHPGQSFEGKPCFDILLDDKAGFQHEYDWFIVQKAIAENVL